MKSGYKRTIYRHRDYILKRAIDLIVITLSLPVLMPLMSLIALAIRFESSGSVFFKQRRAGVNCTPFSCYKFRTMYENADQSLHQEHIKAFVAGELDLKNGVKLTNDPRVTRVGKLLRTLSLDEIPQIINVIKGEMSLIGPRPLPLYEVEEFSLWHSERFLVLPGISGYWQLYGRSRVSFDDQLRMDIYYIRNWSIWFDIRLIILTIPTVIIAKGAG